MPTAELLDVRAVTATPRRAVRVRERERGGDVEVLVDPAAATAGSWRVVAAADHHDRGRVSVTVFPGPHAPAAQVARRLLAAPACGHCGLVRRRRRTYLLAAPDGELVQVGSGCVRELTVTDHSAARGTADAAHAAPAVLADAHARSSAGGLVALRDFLAQAAACIREHGFVAAKDARPGRPATASIALDRARDPNRSRPAGEDYRRADSTIRWGREQLGARDGLDGYHRRLAAVLASIRR